MEYYSYGATWEGGGCNPGGGWKWDDGTPWDDESWNQGNFVQKIAATHTFPWSYSRPQNV